MADVGAATTKVRLLLEWERARGRAEVATQHVKALGAARRALDEGEIRSGGLISTRAASRLGVLEASFAAVARRERTAARWLAALVEASAHQDVEPLLDGPTIRGLIGRLGDSKPLTAGELIEIGRALIAERDAAGSPTPAKRATTGRRPRGRASTSPDARKTRQRRTA
jgi:hypothetical protein